MPSLKKMRQRTDDVKVEWGEDTVWIRWRPGLLTDRFYEELSNIADDARSRGTTGSRAFGVLRAKLVELIDWWDLTEDEGPEGPDNPMVPITGESLAELPEQLMLRITDKLLAEGSSGEASRPIGAGENPVEPSDTSQGGPHSFG